MALTLTQKALLAVAVGGAGAWALTALARKKRPAGAGSDCDKLPTQTARDACQAANVAIGIGSAVWDAVAGKVTNETADEVDAHNARLNGAIVDRNHYNIDERFWSLNQGHVEVWGDGPGTMTEKVVGVLKGRQVPKHANGCVPLFGDETGCVPGTKGYARSGLPFSGNEFKTTAGGYVTNGLRKTGWNSYTVEFDGDPLTHKHWKERGAFPLQCESGKEAWWIGGRPQCCPPGFTVVRDQRDGRETLTCQAPISVPAWLGMLGGFEILSPRGTKPDENTQGGVVVTLSERPRMSGTATKPATNAALAALRGRGI